jgi:hypothetical protein
LRGVNGKESAEAPDSLGIKTFSSVRPFKGMREELIPSVDERDDGCAQLNGVDLRPTAQFLLAKTLELW